MFDFDGTVALVRAGWMPVMLDMMMETLTPLGPDPAAVRAEAEDYVARLTGKDTLFQMQAFVDHVRALGGNPASAEEYRDEVFHRLSGRVSARLHAVEDGSKPPESLLVPGTRALLEALRSADVAVYLASGTAHEHILRESALLRIDQYFDGIYGSAPTSLTKAELLEKLISGGVRGEEIVTFGDGRVEIEVTKAVGGAAVGLATDELACLTVDDKKRGWLIKAGADYIVPNFLQKEELLEVVAGIR